MEIAAIIGALAGVVLIGLFAVFGTISISRGHAFSMGAFGASFSYQGA